MVSNYEGILACEINLNKKEVNIVYDSLSVSIDKIMTSFLFKLTKKHPWKNSVLTFTLKRKSCMIK